jgi:uncharacterized membrane protein
MMFDKKEKKRHTIYYRAFLGLLPITWYWILGLGLLLIIYLLSGNTWVGILFLFIIGSLASLIAYNRYFIWKHRSKPESTEEPEELLSNDAKRILFRAKKGIVRSSEVIQELGLSRRSYFTNLKKLMQLGLVEKRGNMYRLTKVGEDWFRKLNAS